MKNKRIFSLWFLVVLSSLLLTLPYVVPHAGLLMLIAFLPLFQLEKIITEFNIRRGYIYYYTVFLLWNTFSTYWIYNATIPGVIAACTLNAF